MSMVIGRAMPGNFAGDVTRPLCNIEAFPIDGEKAPMAYGLAVKLTAGKVQSIEAADTVNDIYGFFARPYPDQSSIAAGNPGFGEAVPDPDLPASVMVRGYMSVHVGAGTAMMGGKVYVRVATPAEGKPLGGVEAAADGSNTVELPEAVFTTVADADGNAEIRFYR